MAKSRNIQATLVASTAVVLALSCAVRADLQLASPFTDHMVLQRDVPVPVWGTADPGAKVTVAFSGQTKTAAVNADGNWRISLDPLKVSSEAQEMRIAEGTNSARVLRDVLVGEVWLASGQSNMEFPMSKSRASWAGVNNEEQEIAAANYPEIRFFTGAKTCSLEPQKAVSGTWQVCTPENAPGFSAVAYFFARGLYKELKVPVGILSLSFGASTAQAWIRREAIAGVPKLKPVLDAFDAQVRSYSPPNEEELKQWQLAADKAKAEGKRAPRRPKPDPAQDQHNPTVLFNGMLAPVIPYAIRGAIWYQGESITAPKELFPLWNATLIKDWRNLWGSQFPFYLCQLAGQDAPSNSPAVREMQAEALELPNTGMAVTIDIGERKNVHPRNKQDVGARLALIALAKTYGRDAEFSGPVFESMRAEGDELRLTFSHAGGGLVAKGGPLKTLEIAGADDNYVPAEAVIEGSAIVARAPGVSSPISVRYAWANYPEGANLFNRTGLPAAPFREKIAPDIKPGTPP